MELSDFRNYPVDEVPPSDVIIAVALRDYPVFVHYWKEGMLVQVRPFQRRRDLEVVLPDIKTWKDFIDRNGSTKVVAMIKEGELSFERTTRVA